jgi:hypothetical protein
VVSAFAGLLHGAQARRACAHRALSLTLPALMHSNAHLDILICLYAYLDLRYCWLGEFTFASSTGFQLVPSSCHEVVW